MTSGSKLVRWTLLVYTITVLHQLVHCVCTCRFPLYLKGVERALFHYAVHLLNKNIAQVDRQTDRRNDCVTSIITLYCRFDSTADMECQRQC